MHIIHSLSLTTLCARKILCGNNARSDDEGDDNEDDEWVGIYEMLIIYWVWCSLYGCCLFRMYSSMQSFCRCSLYSRGFGVLKNATCSVVCSDYNSAVKMHAPSSMHAQSSSLAIRLCLYLPHSFAHQCVRACVRGLCACNHISMWTAKHKSLPLCT